MFSKFKITEFFCMADNFCKEFVLQQGKYMVDSSYKCNTYVFV